MPLQKLQFRPGINRESTTLANEGGWFDCDKVRFRSGYPEKIGGWEADTGTYENNGISLAPEIGSFWGVCRSLWNWLGFNGYNYMGLGTNLKFYVQNGVDGTFYDVTPERSVVTIASGAFTTVSGSRTVTVNATAFGGDTGDFVTISGVSGPVNGIPAADLNKEFRITYVSGNSYNITVSTSATSSSTTGAATFTYQIEIGSDIAISASGWGSGTWGGVIIGTATTTTAEAVDISETSIDLVSAASFTTSGSIIIDSEIITYSGKSTNTLTGCVRGADGSTAATHILGATVTQATTFTGWGESATSITEVEQLRLWSQQNYGQDLIINYRGGPMYYWAVNSDPSIFDPAQWIDAGGSVVIRGDTAPVDSTCPDVVNVVMVSDSSRFVIAFGCNDPSGLLFSSTQNPLLIRWSDQEQFNVWTPSAINQAGDYTLSHGSEIVATLQTRQEILVWTDSALYTMQYLGPPYVWGFQIMGDNISIAGPNATATASNITYWMGVDKFYMYSGRVETLPCAVRQYIFDDANMAQAYQFFAGTSEGYNEIWWFYVSVSGPDGTGTVVNPNTEVDRYAVFNHLERTWYYGNLQRTAWLDTSLRDVPNATGYANKLVYHETGNDDGTTNPPSPIEAYCQSSDFDIGDGHNFGLVSRIIPDITFDGSDVNNPTVTFTVRPRQNPGANYGTSNNPAVVSDNNYTNLRQYNVQQFTEYVYVRVRGRQLAFRIDSSDLGVAWQLGTPRIDLRPDGRR